jgi:hypothetical protein
LNHQVERLKTRKDFQFLPLCFSLLLSLWFTLPFPTPRTHARNHPQRARCENITAISLPPIAEGSRDQTTRGDARCDPTRSEHITASRPATRTAQNGNPLSERSRVMISCEVFKTVGPSRIVIVAFALRKLDCGCSAVDRLTSDVGASVTRPAIHAAGASGLFFGREGSERKYAAPEGGERREGE